MMSKKQIVKAVFAWIFLGLFLVLAYFIRISMKERNVGKRNTALVVKNEHPSDSVTVYLTLSKIDGFLDDVNGIFGIKSTNKLQGSFIIAPNDSIYYYNRRMKPISGNICFGSAPVNCPFDSGTTLYEFTLNNNNTVDKAQETVDISCIYGVSSYGSINLYGGGTYWVDGAGNHVSSIRNKSLYKNRGISGVYPFGCTTCTDTTGVEQCVEHPPYSKPNSEHICNVQRDASKKGGMVVISYIGKGY